MDAHPNTPEIKIEWPVSCRYFVPQLHDAEFARHLVLHDTDYVDPNPSGNQHRLTYIDVKQDGVVSISSLLGDDGISDMLDTTSLSPGSSRLIFVPQKRLYFVTGTVNTLGIPLEVWLHLLIFLDIPPFAVELLQDNNGGTSSHTSYCGDNVDHHQDEALLDDKPCAYHVSFKQADWGNQEHFIYARHDFHTQTNVILVAGTLEEDDIGRIYHQLKGTKRPRLFSILLFIATLLSREIEKYRWQADFQTQKLESETGFSTFEFGIKPLAPAQLSVRKDMTVATDLIRQLIVAANNLSAALSFLCHQIQTYHEVSAEHKGYETYRALDQQLRDAYSQRRSQTTAQVAQMENLLARVDSQWGVVNALMSQHNNRLSIEMARDTKEESSLMRRIAFVTIVFLPATFMATFFSMSFFVIDRQGIYVSNWIWLYSVTTVPLTVVLSQQYGKPDGIFEGWRAKFRKGLRRIQRRESSPS